MSARYDFTINQGEDFDRTLTWTDASNVAINTTGYTGILQIKLHTADVTPLLSITESSGLSFGGANGKITIHIGYTITKDLDFTDAVYNLELYPPTGGPKRLLSGIVSLSKEIVL